MAVRMTGLALGGGTEHGSHIVITFDIGLRRKVKVPTIGLGFPGEGILQVLFCLTAL